MVRNLGISLLFLSLLAAGIDGFRVRERARAGVPNGAVSDDSGLVHVSEYGAGVNPPR
jgi:hypothetical protein